jgi:hypothetical protein
MPGVIGWLRRGMGESSTSWSAAIGGIEEFVNPAAARAKEDLREQNERVMPTPSPGDRMLDEGRIVLRRHAAGEPAPSGSADEPDADRPSA